jgi:competence protein ComEC
MSLYDKAFWAMGLFLIGVLLASILQGISSGLLIVLFVSIVFGVLCLLLRKEWLAILSMSMLIGGVYFHWYAAREVQSFTAPLGETMVYSGIVTKVIAKDASQSVDLRLTGEYRGVLRVTARPFPVLRYGDALSLIGTLSSIDGPSKGYFVKEGIGALMKFPKEQRVVAHNQGSWIFSKLLTVRAYVEESFMKTFSPESATLMTGLVLGKSGGFNKEFTEKLKLTGTTHLVALSGYNISIIIKYLLLFISLGINRRIGVWICVLVVIGFVVMTGAEASVVRAAIMATIMLLAEQSSRMYSVRNAIVAAAFGMVIYNPTILVFDVGFQLSFLALMGIVYLQPAIEKFLKIPDDAGVLEWRKNSIATIAAQLAVLPIILTSFGALSPLSIITNVLLLSFIPYTMGFGFLVIIGYLISPHLAFIISIPAKLLLLYELRVIDFFAALPFSFQVEQVPYVVSTFYYLVIIAFIVYVQNLRRVSTLETA